MWSNTETLTILTLSRYNMFRFSFPFSSVLLREQRWGNNLHYTNKMLHQKQTRLPLRASVGLHSCYVSVFKCHFISLLLNECFEMPFYNMFLNALNVFHCCKALWIALCWKVFQLPVVGHFSDVQDLLAVPAKRDLFYKLFTLFYLDVFNLSIILQKKNKQNHFTSSQTYSVTLWSGKTPRLGILSINDFMRR